MAPNGTKVQDKKNHQGYESLEMYSSEEEYEFETLKDYESDNSDSYLAPVFMQNLESPKLLESIEKSWFETQKFQTTFDTKEYLQSQQQPNGSCIPKKGSQLYIELVRQCKQKGAKVILEKIKSTNSVQRSSRKIASDILDGILAEKGTKDQKLIENEKSNNVRRGPTLNENFMKWKNSKSEKELNENFPLKFEGASADRWKSKLAGNNSTYKGKKAKEL